MKNISKCYLIQAAKHDAEEADSRYNEAMRKMRMLQAELDKAEDRANEIENKNTMLQEELKEAGMNVKSLRVKIDNSNKFTFNVFIMFVVWLLHFYILMILELRRKSLQHGRIIFRATKNSQTQARGGAG